MKKKILGILMVLATAFTFTTGVLAEETTTVEETNETTEVTNEVKTQEPVATEEVEKAKYFGDAVDFNNTPQVFTFASRAYYPVTEFKDKETGRVLVAGEDYIRTYITTRDKSLNMSDKVYANPEKYSDNDFVTPGYIWENVKFIGKYYGVQSIRHNIANFIYVYGDTTSKDVGTDDPEFTGTVIYLTGYDYEKGEWTYSYTDDATKEGYKYDIKDLVSVTREEGEEVGEYTTTPSIEFPKDYIPTKYSDTSYHIIKTVPAYVYLYTGKLTINQTYKVYTNYVDQDGRVIADQEYIHGLHTGDEYTTTEKHIEGYELKRVDGERTGIIGEKNVHVTYEYEFVMGEGGNEEEPVEEVKQEVVQTGSEIDYSLMSSGLITLSLIGLAIFSKKRKNN